MKGTIWCLHGAVGMADDWRGFSPPGWSVKRVDLWRFLDCCPMSMPEFGAALNREAEATDGPNVLLGYSMGGRLALHALLEDRDERPRSSSSPESVTVRRTSGGACPYPWAAAVIVSAHPGLEDEEEKVARRAKDAEWGAKALNGDWRDFLEAWNGQDVLETSNIERRTFSIEGRLKLEMRRQAVARSFMDWTLGGQEALWDRIPDIACPLLWVVGEKDEKFRELSARLGSRGPIAGEIGKLLEFWTAPGAGHRVPWDEREAFVRKVGEFLERAVS